MGEEIFKINGLLDVIDGYYQSIAIPFDVEDCKISHRFCRTIGLSDFFQILPSSPLDSIQFKLR
jgi:hypothetical protein